MDIVLKQPDIEKAVRQYVINQGISLRNKTMVIDFNMGRGSNGLSANVVIDDVDIPGDYAPDHVEEAKPVVTLQADTAAKSAIVINDTQSVTHTLITADSPKDVSVATTQADAPVTLAVVETAAAPTTAAEAIAQAKEAAAASTTAKESLFVAPAEAIAAVATQGTEAARAVPLAEAKPALFEAVAVEVNPAEAPVADAAPVAKASTSLFG